MKILLCFNAYALPLNQHVLHKGALAKQMTVPGRLAIAERKFRGLKRIRRHSLSLDLSEPYSYMIKCSWTLKKEPRMCSALRRRDGLEFVLGVLEKALCMFK